MKIRILVLTLISALALGSSLPAAEKSSEKETELSLKMEKISGAWRRAKRSIGDASKNADTLKDLELIRVGLTESLNLKPEITSTKPAADQAKFVADYQAGMKKFIALCDKLEAALKADNNAEAEKICGAMADSQKAGHKEFKKDDKKKKS